MFNYELILDLAILLFITKFLGIITSKLQLPQVVGNLLGGLLVGPAVLGWVGAPEANSPIDLFAKVGVVLIMFSAGLETDIKHLKSTGLASTVITILGVAVPLAGGFVIAGAFHGFGEEMLLQNLFHGVVLTATSVSITVTTLKEMGKLNTKVGASILSAALLDDIIGLFILTIVLGASGDTSQSSSAYFITAFSNLGISNIGCLAISTLLFFVFAIIAGIVVNKIFVFLSKKFPNTRRLSIFSLVFCLLMAYSAEEVFGIADVTGAFIGGVALSNLKDTPYIEKKIDTTSYMVFAPIFFASIGLKASFDNFTGETFAFAVCFLLIGLLTKVLGCGLGAKMCHYSTKDSLRVGFGMMARAEVALIVVQKAIERNLIESEMITIVLLLIIVSSLVTPICLKLVYKKDKNQHDDFLKPLNVKTVASDYDDFLLKGDEN